MKLLRNLFLVVIVIFSFALFFIPGLSSSGWTALLPAGVSLWFVLNSGYGMMQAQEKKKLHEMEKRHAETDARDAARRKDLEDKTRAAELLMETLSLGQRDFLRKYPLGKGSPVQQLMEMSEKYGLPVTTPMLKAEPLSLTTQGLPAHTCGGKLYASYLFCPEHREAVPMATAPPPSAVSAGTFSFNPRAWDAYQQADLGKLRADLVKALASGRAPVILPQQEDEQLAPAEDEYVPAGQADLSSELARMLKEQVTVAQRTQWAAGRKREWRMNEEWYAEVQKLEVSLAGGRLYAYPVFVGVQYGFPELVAL